MSDTSTILITGSRKGIGRYLAEHYLKQGNAVIGCSRGESDLNDSQYTHFSLDIADEKAVAEMFSQVRRSKVPLDALINNAGIASMNHALLTPVDTVRKILDTNVVGTFVFCRAAAKLMQKRRYGRIVNFTTVAVPLKLAGEAVYASSKAAITSLTQILAKELGSLGITVNAVGPTPIKTDLIKAVPESKIDDLISRQAIHRFGEYRDVANVIDFYLKPESDFITGQTIYLGGI